MLEFTRNIVENGKKTIKCCRTPLRMSVNIEKKDPKLDNESMKRIAIGFFDAMVRFKDKA